MRIPFLLVPFFLLSLSLHAQTLSKKDGKTQTGPVNVKWHEGITYAGSILTVKGDVTVSSPTFGLNGQVVTLEFAPAKGKQETPTVSGLRRATAVGAPDRPVTGHFEQASPTRSFTVRADQAVYTPTSGGGKAQTGTLDLTGDVVLTMTDASASNGPAVFRSDHMTVRIGPGPEFPQFEGPAGTLEFTPLQP